MKQRTLSFAIGMGLAAIVLAGCNGPFGPIVEREEPTPTQTLQASPTPAATEVPADRLPPGVSVASVTPQLPPTQIVGATVGAGVASTAVIGPPLTMLPPGGPPQLTPPFTPQGNPASTPTVTLADNGGTITIRVGQSFLLYLSQAGMDWMVSIEDESVVNRMKDATPPEGAQGYFTGLKPGKTTLMAVGDAPCRQVEPPCMMPSMLFQVEIVVQ